MLDGLDLDKLHLHGRTRKEGKAWLAHSARSLGSSRIEPIGFVEFCFQSPEIIAAPSLDLVLSHSALSLSLTLSVSLYPRLRSPSLAIFRVADAATHDRHRTSWPPTGPSTYLLYGRREKQ